MLASRNSRIFLARVYSVALFTSMANHFSKEDWIIIATFDAIQLSKLLKFISCSYWVWATFNRAILASLAAVEVSDSARQKCDVYIKRLYIKLPCIMFTVSRRCNCFWHLQLEDWCPQTHSRTTHWNILSFGSFPISNNIRWNASGTWGYIKNFRDKRTAFGDIPGFLPFQPVRIEIPYHLNKISISIFNRWLRALSPKCLISNIAE